ncbi:TPA: DNA ligase-associated DEXH box helicase, partial [Candidatus Micrarchaeota archaeon]|nr:DNA ligase-associated DEXH box helicase [Candidatus Micrarchaeota archaeon]
MLIHPLRNGVIIDTGTTRIAVDVPRPVRGAVHLVTHAHADHVGAARSTEVLATRGSHEILK